MATEEIRRAIRDSGLMLGVGWGMHTPGKLESDTCDYNICYTISCNEGCQSEGCREGCSSGCNDSGCASCSMVGEY